MTTVRIAAVAWVILILDQATKMLVVHEIPLHESISIAPFFSLTHVRNTGAAFGMFAGGNLFFIVISFVILAVLGVLHRSFLSQGMTAAWGLALVWGGAVGNLIDRLFRGSVVDFLDFFWGTWHWPAFNVADASICVGTGLLILSGFISNTGPGVGGRGTEKENFQNPAPRTRRPTSGL
jgi:signal peptidase II